MDDSTEKMQGQGCRQTSTHNPERGEALLPVLKGTSVLQASLTSLFLGLVGSPSTVLMLFLGERPREVLGCLTLLAGSVPLKEMDFVQNKDIWWYKQGRGLWERAQREVAREGPVCV